VKRKSIKDKSQNIIPSVANLGPLPKSDRKAELERTSLAALQAFLPADKFVFRDERISDAGVDASIELLIDSAYTGLRSHIQLKATESDQANRDGSISISIKTQNLNYLLNHGSSSLYVLYAHQRNEFRFLWAADEARRLSKTNMRWTSRKFITLKFDRILTPELLDEIHSRIRREAQFHREIGNILTGAAHIENLIIRISPETLRVTDPGEAKQILRQNGIAIVSAGFASEVKNLARLLTDDDLRDPRVLLVLAHADYTTGRYFNARASLKEAELRINELSEDDRSFLQALGDGCDYQTGSIDTPTAIRRVTDRLKHSSTRFAIAFKLHQIRQVLFNETDIERRGLVLTQLQELVQQIKVSDDYSIPFRLYARIILTEAEGFQLVFRTLRVLGEMRIRRSLPQLREAVEDHPQLLERWQFDINSILKDAVTQNHPLLLATALQVQVTIAVHYITNQYRLTPDQETLSAGSEELLLKALENVEGSIGIARKAGNLEAELRGRMLVADIYELLGRQAEAKEIANEILPKAKAMEYAALIWRAEAHLNEQTMRAKLKDLGRPLSDEQVATMHANFTDQEIRDFAKRLVGIAELPVERLPIVERDLFSRRDISREKFKWCRHLELVQDLQHEQHRETHYAKDHKRYSRCLLLAYESKIGDRDWLVVIGAFKRAYCENCIHKSPF
jgi:hypothetical protein